MYWASFSVLLFGCMIITNARFLESNEGTGITNRSGPLKNSFTTRCIEPTSSFSHENIGQRLNRSSLVWLQNLKISFFCFVLIALLKSSDFNDFDNISYQNWWFTSQIWYDNLPIRNFIRFPDFFRIFPDFPQIFRFLRFWQYFIIELTIYLSIIILLFSGTSSGFRIFPGFSKKKKYEYISSNNFL